MALITKLILFAACVLPFDQLSSKHFAARHRARTLIIESGDLPAIEAEIAKDSGDAEVRQSLEHCRNAVHDRYLQAEMNKIIEGKESKYPGWESWIKHAGKGEISRDLFLSAIITHKQFLLDFLRTDVRYQNAKGLVFAKDKSWGWEPDSFVVIVIMHDTLGKRGRDTYTEGMRRIVRNYGQWYDACIYECTLCEKHYYADKDYVFIRDLTLKLRKASDEDNSKTSD